MTTTPAAGPSAPADNKTTLRLSRLLKRPVADSRGESIGRLADASVVGLTAGASAPPAVVSEIITALSGLGTVTVTERVTTTESVQFGLPREVRR